MDSGGPTRERATPHWRAVVAFLGCQNRATILVPATEVGTLQTDAKVSGEAAGLIKSATLYCRLDMCVDKRQRRHATRDRHSRRHSLRLFTPSHYPQEPWFRSRGCLGTVLVCLARYLQYLLDTHTLKCMSWGPQPRGQIPSSSAMTMLHAIFTYYECASCRVGTDAWSQQRKRVAVQPRAAERRGFLSTRHLCRPGGARGSARSQRPLEQLYPPTCAPHQNSRRFAEDLPESA